MFWNYHGHSAEEEFFGDWNSVTEFPYKAGTFLILSGTSFFHESTYAFSKSAGMGVSTYSPEITSVITLRATKYDPKRVFFLILATPTIDYPKAISYRLPNSSSPSSWLSRNLSCLNISFILHFLSGHSEINKFRLIYQVLYQLMLGLNKIIQLL